MLTNLAPAGSEAPALNNKHSECQKNDSRTAFEVSFGRYNTATHAGLRSHESSLTIQVWDHCDTKQEQPKISYRSPTVEDEDEQSHAVGSKDKIALDQYQEQSTTNTARSPGPDSQSLPGEVADHEILARNPLKNLTTIVPEKPEIQSKEMKQILENASKKDYLMLKHPHITRSKKFPSRVVPHLSKPLHTRFEKRGLHGKGQDRRSNELKDKCISKDSKSDSQDRYEYNSKISSDSQTESPIHPSRRLSQSPTSPRTPSRYVYRDGATVLATSAEFESPINSSRRLSNHTPRPRARKRYVYQDGTTIPIPSSGNQWNFQGSPDLAPLDHSNSPCPTSTQYRVDSNRNSSRAVSQYYEEATYASGSSNVAYSTTTTMNPLNTHKPSSDARDCYPRKRSSGREQVFYDREDNSKIHTIVPLTLENLNKYIPDSPHEARRALATWGTASRTSRRSRSASMIVTHSRRDDLTQRRQQNTIDYADGKGFIDSKPSPPWKQHNSDDDDERYSKDTLFVKSSLESRKAKRARDRHRGKLPLDIPIKTAGGHKEKSRLRTWQENVSRWITAIHR